MSIGVEKKYLSDLSKEFKCKRYLDNKYSVIDIFNLKGKVVYNFKILDVYVVNRAIRCDCKCLCGKSEIKENYQILDIVGGRKKTCGCSRGKGRAIYSNFSYINKQFGNLVVLDIVDRDKHGDKILDCYKKKIFWHCKCLLCGNTDVYLPAIRVVNGNAKDCGCSQKERNTKYKDKSWIGKKVNENEILDIIDLRGVKTYWVLKCSFCGSTYISDASHVFVGHRKSCGCISKSFGESVVEKVLEEYNIKFEREKMYFDLLADKTNKHTYLRYDFVIYDEKDRLVGNIEYNGLQHYSVEYQRGAFSLEEAEKKLRYLQYCDKLKYEYMLNKGVYPCHIKYTRKYKEIKIEVVKYLKTLKLIK